jgi:hypothetical protein
MHRPSAHGWTTMPLVRYRRKPPSRGWRSARPLPPRLYRGKRRCAVLALGPDQEPVCLRHQVSEERQPPWPVHRERVLRDILAKFWLEPVRLQDSSGFNRVEIAWLKAIERGCTAEVLE